MIHLGRTIKLPSLPEGPLTAGSVFLIQTSTLANLCVFVWISKSGQIMLNPDLVENNDVNTPCSIPSNESMKRYTWTCVWGPLLWFVRFSLDVLMNDLMWFLGPNMTTDNRHLSMILFQRSVVLFFSFWYIAGFILWDSFHNSFH